MGLLKALLAIIILMGFGSAFGISGFISPDAEWLGIAIILAAGVLHKSD